MEVFWKGEGRAGSDSGGSGMYMSFGPLLGGAGLRGLLFISLLSLPRFISALTHITCGQQGTEGWGASMLLGRIHHLLGVFPQGSMRGGDHLCLMHP